MKRKVLIFVYDYPPRGWSGVQRTVKFVRYMSEYGWDPIIMTPADWYFSVPLDYSFLDEVAHAKTIRTSVLTRADCSRLVHVLWKGLKPVFSPLGKNEAWLVEGLRWRIEAFLFPDVGMTWLPYAVREGLRAVRMFRPEVIYATAPPYSTLISAWIVSKISKVPLVADLRDLWVDAPLRIVRGRIKKKMDKFMESAVLSNAAAIVTTTKTGADLLREKYGRKTEKVFTLYNGYDEKDFSSNVANQKVREASRELIISHVGSLYGDITPAPFLKALATFLETGFPIPVPIRVRFIGETSQFTEVFQAYEYLGIVEVQEAVDHCSAIAMMKSSDVLLLILPERHKKVIPGKVFEYFATGRPILGVVPLNGEIAQLLEQSRNAWVVDAGDIDGISRCLDEICQRWISGKLVGMTNKDYVQAFERRHLTSQLCKIFTSIACCKQPTLQ